MKRVIYGLFCMGLFAVAANSGYCLDDYPPPGTDLSSIRCSGGIVSTGDITP